MPTEFTINPEGVAFAPDILTALFETAEDGIIVSDNHGRIIFGNRAAFEINDGANLPASAHERSIRYEAESGGPASLKNLPSLRALSEGEVRGQEVVLVSSKGHKKHLICNSRALYSSSGERIGAVVVLHDRTSLHNAVDQKIALEKERSELMALNQQLEQFSAVAAHDLKSPLNSITQFVELLKEDLGDKIGPNEAELINYISNAGNRLRMLIDDLLSYARSGSVLGENERVDLNKEVSEVLDLLKLEIKKTNAVVEVSPLPTVIANRVGIHQLLQNLISNSLKYRNADQPKICVYSTERSADWCVSIKDNGIGINESDRQHTFELFKRFEGSAGREGTGLGLPICKRIVESHGGSIWIESEKGVGTTVHFTLPKKA